MIGFFDSGFGGLQTMKIFKEIYPQYDYIFLADQKNCPYGTKSGEEIQKLTFAGLNWLFDNGAQIVILACNTAAAYSIRNWQTLYPEKKVLSITIPGIEEIISKSNTNSKIGILATQATINSNIYNDLFSRFGGKNNDIFEFVMAPKLVEIVEKGIKDETIISTTIQEYLTKFHNIEYLVLGCTHFPVLMKYFKNQFGGGIIDPSFFAAQKFKIYLNNHPEIESKVSKNQNIQIYTSGDKTLFDKIGSTIFDKQIQSQHIDI